MKRRATYILFIFTLVSMLPQQMHARFFDANAIFTDAELFDGTALSRTAIQQFFEQKDSVLKNVVVTVGGVKKLVSEIVYEIGKQYNISQKYLLAKLQQEQGLLEKSSAPQKALDWATGYSCYNGRCNEKYRGIYEQLDAAASVQKIYAEKGKNAGYFSFGVNQTAKTADGYTVTPVNQATANLYIYTPYHGSESNVGGNYFFWRVWNQYFTERPYAEGALLREPSTGTYWKIEKNKRRKYLSEALFLKDHRAEDAIDVDGAALAYYEIGAPITYANNSIVQGEGSHLLYLLSDGYKHRIVGAGALALLGFHIAAETEAINPVLLSQTELDSFPEGEPITPDTLQPQGVLMKDEGGAIYFVKNGTRHFVDPAVWKENFNRKEPAQSSSSVIGQYPPGDPIALQDGSIVRSDEGSYYLISDSQKHKIMNADVVRRVFGEQKFSNAALASDATLALHGDGDKIEYIDDTVSDPARYVSYAEKTGGASSAPAATATSPSYLALYDEFNVPDSMSAGSSVSVSLSFKNRGTAAWQPGKVFLKLIDENSMQSSFMEQNRIPLSTTAGAGQSAVFSFEMSAPASPVAIKEWFILEYEDSEGRGIEMPGGLVGKTIQPVSGVSAQVVAHSIPVAVRNKWGPIDVSVTLKNTSTRESWTARRTAMYLHNDSEEDKSPFYDPNDWLDDEVVGVPLNRLRIAPGENGVVRFTLDPRGVAPGVYRLVFSGELRDIDEDLFINGKPYWERLIRVDP